MSNSPRKIRVLLAEDHTLLREVLAEVLQAEPDIEVIGQTGSGLEAITLAKATRPDLVLLDYSMPGLDGAETARRMLAELPTVSIIGLSMHEKSYIGAKMRAAGAAAYVCKGDAPERLIGVIHEVFDGEYHGTSGSGPIE